MIAQILLVTLLGGSVDISAATKALVPKTKGLRPEVLESSLQAFHAVEKKGKVERSRLTVIDYSLPSTTKRIWVLDLESNEVLFHGLVAHGKNTGENLATDFGNDSGSSKSSLGVFLTAETYEGKHGYSLKLDGLEKGFNEKARDRAIVIHGAWYVTEAFGMKQGRLGRSWGCPALDPAVSRDVIDAIKNGSVLVAWYPDAAWLKGSAFLKQ